MFDVLPQRRLASRGRVAAASALNSPEQAPTVTMHDLLGANPVASCAGLFRREAIHPLPGWLFEQPWGDWQLCFIAAQHGAIHYHPDLMAVHLTHPNGMWSRLSRLEALEGIATWSVIWR
jgi:hypothetical protein